MPPVPDAESPANICLRPPGLLVEGRRAAQSDPAAKPN